MLLRLILILLLPATGLTALETDSLLARVGSAYTTLQIEGRLSTTGKQTFSGMPFSVAMDSVGSYAVRMGGPFGLTAARMVATADTFVMVNYLQQEVWDGDPRSPDLAAASHLPIPTMDVVALLRGRVPGDQARFTRSTQERADGTMLFLCRDSAAVEYVLIDTVQNVLKQYQRKDHTGSLLLDVAFQDLQNTNGAIIPRRIIIAAKDRTETATVEIDEIILNEGIERIGLPSIPKSFSRRSFR